MKKIQPLKGVFYSPGKGAPHENIAPPYDIISREEHQRLLAKSPRNVVRFTLGENPGKRGDFSKGAGALKELLEKGILQLEDRPRLYLYKVYYSLHGRNHLFTGLVGKLNMASTRVLEHERTMERVEAERLEALSGTRANLGLILLACRGGPELFSVLNQGEGEGRFRVPVNSNEVHSVFTLREEVYPELAELLEKEDFVVADGHHRFATAKKYWELNPDFPQARYCLVVLGTLEASSGYYVLPYHRSLRFSGTSEARAWAEQVKESFTPASTNHADLTLYFPGSENGMPLKYDREEESLISFLHRRFLDKAGQVRYVRDIKEPLHRVKSGEPEVALCLRAVNSEELLGTVKEGKFLPPKSTYFFPKLYSGVIMRLLDFDV